jgi:hypothetical protein
MASFGAGSRTDSTALTGTVGLTGPTADGGPLAYRLASPSACHDELPRDARDQQRLRAALWDSLAFLRREARQPAPPARRFTTADLLPQTAPSQPIG